MRGKSDELDLRSPEDSQRIRSFSPLDPAERLPRDEILAGDRGGLQLQRLPGSSWRKLTRVELAAAVGFPALLVLGIVLGTSGAPTSVAVGSIALLVLALAAFAFSGRH